MAIQPTQTLNAFSDMVARQGGGLIFYQNRVFPISTQEFFTAARKVPGYHPFSVSIYNKDTETDEVSLTLLVSPSDITIGNVAITSNTYTREGWVTTIWGKQQTTIAGSGSTAGFYVPESGLTNRERRSSLGFIDFQTLIAMFKNNGYYFLTTANDQSLWKDGYSRVINVMDSIKIDYDGTTYLGSFSTFTVDESADSPYKMAYNFEFIVSAFNDDIIDGHLRQNGNEYSSRVVLDLQGSDTSFSRTVRMDASELNEDFKLDNTPKPTKSSRFFKLTGSSKKNSKYVDKPFLAHKLDQVSYEDVSEKAKIQVRATAEYLGITEAQLAGFLTFESAGTWNVLVQNPYSSAQGIGQWLDGTAVEMVPTLRKMDLLSSTENIESSAQLVEKFNTVEKQVKLIEAYVRATKVRGGSLKLAIDRAKTPEEKLNTLFTGWFQPDYVGKPADTLLPQDVRDRNDNISTMNDYFKAANSRIKELERREKATTTTQSGDD